MKKIQYEIDDVLKNVASMPLIGTILLNDDGDAVGAGRFWCPKCCCLVDAGLSGAVVISYILPMGASVVKQKPIPPEKRTINETAPHDGVAEGLFLKTVALLSGKETLGDVLKETLDKNKNIV